VAFKEQYPVRTKIVIDNKIIEKVKLFNYLGNMKSYERQLDIDDKLNNYLKITGILNNVFRPQKKPLKKTRIKLYNTLALPVYKLNYLKSHRGFVISFLDELVSRLVPQSGQIRSALDLVPCDNSSSNGDTAALKQRRRSRPLTMEEKEDDILPHLKPLPGTELRFTQFPERHFPEGSTPAEITHHSLDSTYVLETMVATYTRCVFPAV
jgi:A1 cistron-splicing factor AAR2